MEKLIHIKKKKKTWHSPFTSFNLSLNSPKIPHGNLSNLILIIQELIAQINSYSNWVQSLVVLRQRAVSLFS